MKTFIFVTDNNTGWEPLVKTCQWPNIPVPSIPKCDGPNNKNKQRGVELLPQSEHLNENHMELPRHTVSGNPIPLRLFLPSPTLLQSLHCFSLNFHLSIYRTKLQPIIFLKLKRVKDFLLSQLNMQRKLLVCQLIPHEECKHSVVLLKHCLNMQTSLTTAPAAQQMAWVRGVAKLFVQPMTDEESHQETCLKTTIISTIQFRVFVSFLV